MRTLRSWWSRFVGLFDKERKDRELAEELESHLQMHIEDNVRAGMDAAEARRQALIKLGGVERTKERYRERRGFLWLESLLQDVRFGVRMLRKSRGFTVVAVLTLALGIGANTAIFSLMDAVMIRHLPVQKPDELVMLLAQRPGEHPSDGFSNALWEAIRDQQNVFSGVFAWSGVWFDFAQSGGVQRIGGAIVSGNYFNTLGIVPVAGRLIADSDDYRGCPPVAVLSHGFWQVHYAGMVLGSSITLNHQSFQVIGVSSAGFDGVEVGRKLDIAVPVCASALFDKRNLDSRGRWWLSVMGRVKPELPAEQQEAKLEILSPAVMRAALPDGNTARQQQFLRTRLFTKPAPAGAPALRSRFGEPLAVLMAGAAFVLLIACANIAGLLLAQGRTRAKEFAIRVAAGASPSRLVRQLLTESALLSAVGAVLGLLFYQYSTGLLLQNLTIAGNPIFVDLALDGRVLGFTVSLALLTSALVGVLPAIRSTRVSLTAVMKGGPVIKNGRSPFRTGRWIVAGQVALSLVLLVGGALLLRTFVKLDTLDAGFDRNNVVVVSAKPPWFAADTITAKPEQRAASYDEIARRLRLVPGVTLVARSYMTPIGYENWYNSISPDVPNGPTGDQATAYFNLISPGYFDVLRTRRLDGRDFDERDTKTSVPVAIVNQSLARRFFRGVNPVGRHFTMGGYPVAFEIVGIVADSKYESLRAETPPTVFLPALQAPPGGEADQFVVRTSLPASTLIPTIQQATVAVNREIPLTFHTLAEQVANNLVQERLLATLSGFFAVLALLLAMIGLYGVLSYLVVQRTREIGIRIAIGAQRGGVLKMVIGGGMRTVLVGAGIGIVGGLAFTRLLSSLLYGVTPTDPITFFAVTLVLLGVALVACYIPARRATKVDPMTALRHE